MKRIAVYVLMFSSFAFPAKAEFVSAKELLGACESRSLTGISGSFCDGYIMSAYENLIWGSAVAFEAQMQDDATLGEMNEMVLGALGICIPWTVSDEEIILGIVEYIEAYPDIEDDSARIVVFNGLRGLYGCPE